jgi:hypothetical protein
VLVASYAPLLIVGALDPHRQSDRAGPAGMLGTAVAALCFGFAGLRALWRVCGIVR